MSVEQFIRDTKKIARKNGITVHLEKTKTLWDKNDEVELSGYFDDKKIVVATGGPMEKWLGVLVHESCHMDQFLTDKYLWEKLSPGYTLFFNWLQNPEMDVKRQVIEEAVQDIIRMELDCERRTIEKIIKYQLPINLSKYIRGVNVYLHEYLYMLETRKWIPPPMKRKVMSAASSKLKKKYTKIPGKLHKSFIREYSAAV